jgi:hypothetical protein
MKLGLTCPKVKKNFTIVLITTVKSFEVPTPQGAFIKFQELSRCNKYFLPLKTRQKQARLFVAIDDI